MTTATISDPFTVIMTVPSQKNVTVEPSTFNFTSSAKTHNFTITALKDDEVEEEQSVVLNVTTDAVNVAIQSNMPTVIIQDRTILLRESPQSQGVLLGDETTLTCSFEAGYFVTVEWMRDDNILRDEGGMTSPTGGGLGIYSSVLMISDAMFTDCASYRCFASGADTVYSQPAELSVAELMGPSTEMVTAPVGAVDMLSCTIRHCGSFSIDWFIPSDDGTVFPPVIEVFGPDEGSTVSELTDLTDLTSVVTIDTVGLVNENESQVCYVVYEDEGEIGDFEFKMFDYTLENVEVNVTVSPDRPSGNFHEGDTVVLTCNATNPPDVNRSLNFRWVQRPRAPYQFGRVITNSTAPSVTVITGPDYSILTFTNIQDDSDASDFTEDSLEGYYLCRVTNRERNDSVTVTVPVNVISGPTVDFPSPRVTVVNVGDNLTVTCDATSGDNPDITSITILLGDVVVASSNTSETLSYTIVDPQLSDNGTVYLCSAVNALGTTNAIFSLTVRDRPDVIDSETVSSTLLSLLVANVSWTAPNANNDPITSYTVSISSVPDGFSTMSLTVTHLLLQVDPGVEYNVTIAATNEAGTSELSDLVVITGAMRDDANTTLINVLTTNLHIVLEWSPPPLSEPLEGDLPPDSDFSVVQYILLKDAEELDRLDSNVTEYLHNVGGDDGGPTHFRIQTVYSDDLINGLNPETRLTVDIPTLENYLAQLPLSATEPPEEPVTVSNGFTITWNEPELLQNQDLLCRYEVFVGVSEDGRRRRQAMLPTATIDDPNMRSYTFTDGKPFTNYDVRVDGVVELNGEEARVVALTSTPVRTAEGVPSMPLSLQVGDIGITEVTVTWNKPVSPNGIIIHYQVDVVGTGIREIVPTPSTMVTVTGLVGNTDYTVSVQAMNGANLGEVARMIFKTAPGVVTPTLTVNTNLDTERYSLSIARFNTLHGPLSHYVIYVVESDSRPDTSAITDTNQITLAFLASESPAQAVMGDGQTGTFEALNGGGDIPYNNRELDAGTIYFFFIRLYSSVDVTVFSDSIPQRPSTIIPRDDTTADSTVAIIVATDYSVNEGASVVVTLEVTGDFTGDIIVTVMAVIEADDTAAKDDFMFPPEMVTFTTGDTTQTVTVSAVDDMAIENTETFTLMLSTASMDVTFPQPSVEVSIIDWTTERVRIGFEEITLIVEEGADGPSSSLMVSVMEGGATLEREVTVSVMSADVTAMVASDDYDMVSMNLVFSGSVSSHTVTVVAEVDMAVEDEETFTLTLTAGDSSLVELTAPSATVTITDTTALVVELDRSEYSLTEGGSGMMATVSLMAGLSLERDVELTVETTDGTAIDGVDYMSLPGTITLATGTTSEQLGLMALPDSIVEDIEMFSFTVDGTATATVSIMDSTNLGVYMINESPRVTASSVEAEFEITGPVEGVRCFLRSQMDQLWRDCSPAVGSTTGAVSFSDLKPGLYVLKVQAYNRLPVVKRGFVITSDPNYCSLVLVNRGVTVTGNSTVITTQLYGPATQLSCSLDRGTSFTCINPVRLTGRAPGRHILVIIPLGCSGGSKSLSVKFTI